MLLEHFKDTEEECGRILAAAAAVGQGGAARS